MNSCMHDHLQKIKEVYQEIVPCERALFQEFLKSGVKAWETVINVLEKSGELNIAGALKTELHKDFNDPCIGSSK